MLKGGNELLVVLSGDDWLPHRGIDEVDIAHLLR